MADSKTQALFFLDLAAELRIDIYRHVLSTPASIVLGRTGAWNEIPVTVPAQLLSCCKDITSEARPVFFEVTDFALKGPRDLFRLRTYVGKHAATITHLTFHYPSMINKTRIKELRAFKSLRAVGFSLRRFSVYSGFDFDKDSRPHLEPIAIKEIGNDYDPVTELVRQRPSLRYTININIEAVHVVGSRASPQGVALKVS